MILDKEVLMSEDQAVTATAASTNVIDLGTAKDAGPGHDLELNVQITEAFNNLTNLAIALQTDDNSGFSSAKTLATETILLADLVVGAKVSYSWPARNVERYVRMYYTVTGTAPTTGKVHAGLTPGTQDSFQ